MGGIDSGSWGEIIVGLLAMILAIFIFFWSKRRPKISYLVEVKKVIYVHGVSAGELTIKFKDRPISTLVLCSIRIKNTGNFPIKVEDWQKPLEISFPQGANVLDTRIAAVSTDGLPIEFSFDQQRAIKISPVLLNQKDGFILEALTDCEVKPRISARIFDVEKIEEINPEKYSVFWLKGYLFSIVAAIFFSALSFLFKSYEEISGFVAVAMLVAVAIMPLIMVAANFFDPEKKMKI